MTSTNNSYTSRLRSILSRPPGYEMLNEANIESLSQINVAMNPSILFAIAGTTRLLSDWFNNSESVCGRWQDMMTETVIPAMIRALDTDDPETSEASRLAALDDLAKKCEQALWFR